MDIIKEGTHTYLLRQIESEELQDEKIIYYLSVEYEVLRRNSLKTLLPVQLREQDEKKTLLFDITERRSLKILGKSRSLSQEACKKILQSIVDMIQEVDDYMLDLNNIEFLPEYIYEDAYGELQWIYFPAVSCVQQWTSGDRLQEESLKDISDSQSENKMDNKSDNKAENLQRRAEILFEWMLTHIDYENNKVVQFIYGIYNKIRRLGFSKELLERYLSSTEEKSFIEESSKVKEYEESISYEEFFKEDLEKEKQRNGQEKDRGKDQRKGHGKERKTEHAKGRKDGRIGGTAGTGRVAGDSGKGNSSILYTSLNIILGILFIILALIEGNWIFFGITEGFTEVLFRYCIGGILLIAAIIVGIWKCTGKVRQIKEGGCKSKDYPGEDRKGVYSGKTENRINRPLTINTDVEWDTDKEWDTDREGTTILNSAGIRNDGTYAEQTEEEFCPMLRDTETGIVYMIKNCPFYIGSAEGVNQLRISDKTVSREHAVILESLYENGGEGYILRDLDSTNGTWIDGKRMKKGSQKELKEGAAICFANREYRFLIR